MRDVAYTDFTEGESFVGHGPPTAGENWVVQNLPSQMGESQSRIEFAPGEALAVYERLGEFEKIRVRTAANRAATQFPLGGGGPFRTTTYDFTVEGEVAADGRAIRVLKITHTPGSKPT
jgi:hypothetical protein